MTLELRCPQCLSRLNVPDEAKGATAKCPHCRDTFDVDSNMFIEPVVPAGESWRDETLPYSGRSESDGAGGKVSNEIGRESVDSDNPYAPSAEISTESFEVSKVPMRRGMLVARDAFSLAWEIYRANFGTLVLAHAAVLSIGIGISEFGTYLRDQGNVAFGWIVDGPISIGVQWFLMIGLTGIALQASRGRMAIEFGELFGGLRKFPSVCIYMVLYFLLVLAGCCLFIVPGIYFGMRYWAGVHLIVDRDVGFADAFRMSSHFTAGNMTQSLMVAIYAFSVMLLGMLTIVLGPLIFVGLALTLPMNTLLWTVSYLLITRQPVPRMRQS